jgi:hypothetical protein
MDKYHNGFQPRRSRGVQAAFVFDSDGKALFRRVYFRCFVGQIDALDVHHDRNPSPTLWCFSGVSGHANSVSRDIGIGELATVGWCRRLA